MALVLAPVDGHGRIVAPDGTCLRASIDIGTVTCRMLVTLVDGRRKLYEVARLYRITNLGEGVDASKTLRSEAIERVRCAIASFKAELSRYERDLGCRAELRAVATSAARDARNGSDLVRVLAEEGVRLRIVSGDREASLSFSGVSREFPGQSIAVIDIGGGSTEVVAGRAGEGIASARSFDIGCRRATEKLLGEDLVDPEAETRLRRWIRSEMEPHFRQLGETGLLNGRLVGVAGTATTIVSVRDRMERYDCSKVHGAVVTREQLADQRLTLAGMALEERQRVVGLDPKRAAVIVSGLVIMEEVMDLAGIGEFTVSESDILQGVILAVDFD
ncbi:Ppx/GppA family phosphatase [Gordonibacter sp. Marseille-P4307]|uniref:Ppx/GppA phosphatase family protein n=1 Tax=Gordonibacter sp. Marseille-P4307 TaxID=2161815 RepID=UPI001F154ADD|nr:Ppx/GppA family phosphatase [Gordonibacter sp. Marseille-P4307]